MYEFLNLSETTRKVTNGKYIKLKHGYTHYQISEANRNETIILIHGYSTPMFIWKPIFKKLAKNGFKVLRYDLYGRGLSDRPEIKYNLDLFTEQLYELCQKLDLNNLVLVGLSMGSLISIDFTEKYPDLVKKITLVDPTGLNSNNHLIPFSLKIPILNKILFSRNGLDNLIENLSKNLNMEEDNPKYEEFLRQFKKQLIYKGYTRSILSTLLNVPIEKAISKYKNVGKLGIPIQIIWGENDELIEIPDESKVHKILPDSEFEVISDAGHLPNYEKPEIFNNVLMSFINN